MDKQNPHDSLMTPADLRALLACGRTKTWELLAAGAIPSYRVGRLVRIRRRDVEEYLERNRFDAQG